MMSDYEVDREASMSSEREAKRRKFQARGFEVFQCTCCIEDDPICLQFDHPPGRNHDDSVVLICSNCHLRKSALERGDPKPSADPRNPFEVIGHWLLSMVHYFDLLRDVLVRAGHFLIGYAKQGGGDGLGFE